MRLCRGMVDGIAMVIHMPRREGRRVVEEAAFVHGYAGGTNIWDIQRLDRGVGFRAGIRGGPGEPVQMGPG